MNCKWKVIKSYIHICPYAIITCPIHSFRVGGEGGSQGDGGLVHFRPFPCTKRWGISLVEITKIQQTYTTSKNRNFYDFFFLWHFFLYYGLDTESVLCVYVEHYTHLLEAYISPICRSRVGWEVKWGKEGGGGFRVAIAGLVV